MGSGVFLLVLLGVMFVFMFLNTKKQKKAQEEQLVKLSELKEGDKVRTYTGIYATLKRTYESTDGKIAVLELGEGDNKISFEMEFRLIMGLDNKTEIVFDKETSISETESLNSQEEIKPEEVEKAKEELIEKLEENSDKKEEKFDDENDGNE